LGETLKSMFLTISIPTFTGPSISELAPDIVIYRTGKGYQTHKSMSIYLRDILAPGCQRLWDEMGAPTLLIILSMDNCRCHKTDIVSLVYETLNIWSILLPSHASHFL
jgi:hypothetical protein